MNKLSVIVAVFLAAVSLVASGCEKSQVKDVYPFTEGWIDDNSYNLLVVGVVPEVLIGAHRDRLHFVFMDAMSQAKSRIVEEFHRIRYNNSFTGNLTQSYSVLKLEFGDIINNRSLNRLSLLFDNNNYFAIINFHGEGLKKRVLDGAAPPE